MRGHFHIKCQEANRTGNVMMTHQTRFPPYSPAFARTYSTTKSCDSCLLISKIGHVAQEPHNKFPRKKGRRVELFSKLVMTPYENFWWPSLEYAHARFISGRLDWACLDHLAVVAGTNRQHWKAVRPCRKGSKPACELQHRNLVDCRSLQYITLPS